MRSARLARALLLAGFLLAVGTHLVGAAQVLPDGVTEVPFVCEDRDRDRDDDRERREPRTEEERLELERRARYGRVLPAYLAAVPPDPPAELLMPVPGVSVATIADTWGGARGGGRQHEGQDIFAPAGTPVLAAAPGFVYRIGPSPLGGNVVVVVAGGGHRHYYAHLSEFGEIREGQAVDVDTVLGYVGNTGNAQGTPPHLHFGVYTSPPGECEWDAINPLPLLVDR